jgi:glutamate 5-kinase
LPRWRRILAALAAKGVELVLVSSGAIAMGRVMLGMQARPDRLEDAQASAAVGQIALARAYAQMLGAHGMIAGQVLLTSATPNPGGAISMRARRSTRCSPARRCRW